MQARSAMYGRVAGHRAGVHDGYQTICTHSLFVTRRAIALGGLFLALLIPALGSQASDVKTLDAELSDPPPEFRVGPPPQAQDRLLIGIRFPAVADSAATVTNINELLLTKAVLSGHIKPDGAAETTLRDARRIEWGSQVFLRSTYLALELYETLRRRLPENSVALLPMILSFDGAKLSQQYAEPPPAMSIVVDLSAAVMPSIPALAFDGYCGTCGARVLPVVAVDGMADNTVSSCFFLAQFSDAYKSEYYARRSTASLPGYNHGFTYLDAVLSVRSESGLKIFGGDQQCVAVESRAGQARVRSDFGKVGTTNRTGELGVYFFPFAHQFGKSRYPKTIAPESFDIRNSNNYGWAGYLDLTVGTILWTLSRTEVPDEARSKALDADYDRIAKIYSLALTEGQSASANPTLKSVVAAESRFIAKASERYFDAMYTSAFGDSYRRRLVAEVDAARQSKVALVKMLLTAGLIGAVAGSQGVPLFDPSLVTAAETIGGAAGRQWDALATDNSAAGTELSVFSATIGSESIELTSSSLKELRAAIRAALERQGATR